MKYLNLVACTLQYLYMHNMCPHRMCGSMGLRDSPAHHCLGQVEDLALPLPWAAWESWHQGHESR